MNRKQDRPQPRATKERGARPRLSLSTYDAGRQLEELLASDLPDELREELGVMLYALLRDSRTLTEQPHLARIVLLEIAHTRADQAERGERDDAQTMRLLNLKQEIRAAYNVICRGMVSDREAVETDDEEESHDAPEQHGNVVDLSCWMQSRPRPVRHLLFAEKEGEP
jgi:hypothetical protein